MNNFEEIKVIGDGGFGTVTKCRNKETNSIVAIKKMKQRFSSFEECLQLKEVKSLRKIKHENVCRLLQLFRENEYLYLVFECLGETLFKTIKDRNGTPFEESEIRYILTELLSGLSIVHRQGFFHRDLKPENLLWSENGRLKIADFGLAREIRSRPPYTNYVGTRWYRAPEIILNHPFYNSPVDIWSVGCIACELYMLKPIFPGTSEVDQLYKILSVLGTPSEREWPDFAKLAHKRGIRPPGNSGTGIESLLPGASSDAIDFIKQCLALDPKNRPSASRLLQHRFLQGVKTIPKIGTKFTPNSLTKTTNVSEVKEIPREQAFQSALLIPSLKMSPIQQHQQHQPHQQQQSDRHGEKKEGFRSPTTQSRLIYNGLIKSPRSKYYYGFQTPIV